MVVVGCDGGDFGGTTSLKKIAFLDGNRAKVIRGILRNGYNRIIYSSVTGVATSIVECAKQPEERKREGS